MSAQPTHKPVCAVVGVGPGNGAAFARRFAAEGYAVALLARTTGLTSRLAKELPLARAYACDVGDLAAVERTFEFDRIGPRICRCPYLQCGQGGLGLRGGGDLRRFRSGVADQHFWRLRRRAQRHARDEAARCGAHYIHIFIGATASRRGGAKTAPFASSKASQRSLAEIPRPFARAIGDPCLADHRRRNRRRTVDSGETS